MKNWRRYCTYFRFTDASERNFIICLVDAEKINHARKILSGEEKETVHIVGKVIKEKALYNPDWSYHLSPESIDFFGWSIEVCDATMEYVEKNIASVGGSFLPQNSWCPWSSELLEELA